MDNYRRLRDNLKAIAGSEQITIYQGIVTAVKGDTCSCKIDNIEIEDIRLRASLAETEKRILITPKVGSAVIVGSLSGDLSSLVVLQVDEIERIEINGGKLGGLINIETLTEKINSLVDAFNSHTHSLPTGTVNVQGSSGPAANAAPISVPAVAKKADRFDSRDYEDDKIRH